AAPPEYREFASGARYLRYLVTTRAEAPRRRVDVLPITLWDPPASLVTEPGIVGQPVWFVASIERRFWDAGDGRRSRIELVGRSVELRSPSEADMQ
nr:single-stranded DNA-binding protein [Acidimicrobiia bacterium]